VNADYKMQRAAAQKELAEIREILARIPGPKGLKIAP
jgi:hypothetical protein